MASSKAVQKIVILGNAAVGKTCLMERYISGKCVPYQARRIGVRSRLFD